jgi:hypothetical protein
LHPNLRFFRLAECGVTCGANGLFVGGAPMLRRPAVALGQAGSALNRWRANKRVVYGM